MIKKIFRLKEKEVKKVLKFWKPFFSYWIVLNKTVNKLSYNRFWIVLGSKSVNNNITRNFFRRKCYGLLKNICILKNINKNYDVVLVIKKKLKLNRKNNDSIISFEKDLNFLIKKWIIN